MRAALGLPFACRDDRQREVRIIRPAAWPNRSKIGAPRAPRAIVARAVLNSHPAWIAATAIFHGGPSSGGVVALRASVAIMFMAAERFIWRFALARPTSGYRM